MEFFKKLLVYIKSLFKREPKIDNSLVEKEPKIENNLVEEIDLFSKIELGDIIWAKRYKNSKEMNLIPEGHREGSFIVLAVQNDCLLCSQGTSKTPSIEKLDTFFQCILTKDDLDRKIYYRLRDLKKLTKTQVIDIMGKLSSNDIENLCRNIKTKKHCNVINGKLQDFKLHLQLGDIIFYKGNNYLVLDIQETNVVSVLIKFYPYDKIEKFKNKEYSKIVLLNTNDNFKYVNAVNDNVLM